MTSTLEEIGVLAIIVSVVLAIFGVVKFAVMILEILDDLTDLQTSVRDLGVVVGKLQLNPQKKVGTNIP